jgi:hypothetical protein
MGRPIKIMKGGNQTTDIGFPAVSTLTAPVTPSGLEPTEFYGVVGGDVLTPTTAESGTPAYPTINVRVKIGGNSEAEGFILRQKGARKFLVYDGTNTGVCTLSDEADAALSNDAMTISVFLSDSTATRLKKINSKWGVSWADDQYFLNAFQGVEGETAIKSGKAANGTTALARVEVYNTP